MRWPWIVTRALILCSRSVGPEPSYNFSIFQQGWIRLSSHQFGGVWFLFFFLNRLAVVVHKWQWSSTLENQGREIEPTPKRNGKQEKEGGLQGDLVGGVCLRLPSSGSDAGNMQQRVVIITCVPHRHWPPCALEDGDAPSGSALLDLLSAKRRANENYCYPW